MTRWAFVGAGAVSVGHSERLPIPDDPDDRWVATPRGLRPLEAHELPGWLDEELWEVEAEEGRARLVRREHRWSPNVARDFADACAWRARDQGVRVLKSSGHEDTAGRLAALTTLHEVEDWAANAPIDDLPDHAALAADAASLADGRRPESWRTGGHDRGSTQPVALIAANLGFVVAHGAGLERVVDGGSYEDGVRDERAWQASWLAERLGLEDRPLEPA